MLLISLAGLIFACSTAPALLFIVNLRRYRAPRSVTDTSPVRLAVLIPARDEQNNIAACIESVLSNRGIELEVLVLDDASSDRTGEIVSAMATLDVRIKLVGTQSLPLGWNGKQHACWLLAQEVDAPLMVFLDADVRLAPEALMRCVGEMRASRVALLSGFPRLIIIGWMERMLLPLIHFVLLGFLPMGRMRKTAKPAYAAGCGQFLLVERNAYFASGGHASIRSTRHDGLRLPQVFRRHGYRTDIVDLTKLAEVRMYDSARAVWLGLAKNATEGLGAPVRIFPLTLLLLLGQVLPIIAAALWMIACASVLLVGARFDHPIRAGVISGMIWLAVIASFLPRLLAVKRFKQSMGSALLHPLGVVMMLIVQWFALVRQILGRPVEWRARRYSTETGEEIR